MSLEINYSEIQSVPVREDKEDEYSQELKIDMRMISEPILHPDLDRMEESKKQSIISESWEENKIITLPRNNQSIVDSIVEENQKAKRLSYKDSYDTLSSIECKQEINEIPDSPKTKRTRSFNLRKAKCQLSLPNICCICNKVRLDNNY